MKPYIHYPDGTRALLYLEEWRATSGKVEISMSFFLGRQHPSSLVRLTLG